MQVNTILYSGAVIFINNKLIVLPNIDTSNKKTVNRNKVTNKSYINSFYDIHSQYLGIINLKL